MNRLRQERGAVLLMVLVIIALVASLVTEFAHSTLVDLRLTETFRDRTGAYYLAKGGVEAGRMILTDDDNGYDAPNELWGQGIQGYPVGEGFVSIDIEDLDGRLDVNRLVLPNDDADRLVKDRFIRLFDLLDVDNGRALTDALIDWIDENTRERAGGAEDSYYLSLESPYPCKDGPLDTLEELRLVRGVDEGLYRLLVPHLTVHGRQKVNLNTATPEVLAILSDQMDLTIAEEIVEARQQAPFKTAQQLKQLPNYHVRWYVSINPAIDPLVDVQSDSYRIRSIGSIGEGVRRVEAVVKQEDGRYGILYWRVD